MAKITMVDGTVFEGTPAEIMEMTRLQTEASVEQADEPLKAGDFVTIERDGYFTEGTPYEVRIDERGELFVFDNDGDERWLPLREGKYTKLSDEEVASAKAQAEADAIERKRTAVFTENGRKVNEYREGDIVRATNTSATGLEVGHIATVTEVDGDGDIYTDVNNTRGSKAFYGRERVEPVTFVENRLDRK